MTKRSTGYEPGRTPAFTAAMARHATAADSKTIKDVQIVSRIASALRLRPPIDPSMKLSDIPVGNLNSWDLALTVMAYEPFRRDELELRKRDVLNVDTLGEFGDLVFAFYIANGWTIEQ